MNQTSADQFRDELNPGERIIWSGQPQQGFMLRPADALMIPFSFMWAGFAFSWEFSVISNGGSFFFMLWGIPFILMGLYITIGRFFVDLLQRSRTYYALTSERVIILSGLFNQNVKTIRLQRLPEINLTTRSNGRGTITFGASHPMSWMYVGGGFPNMGRYHIAPSFEMIGNAKVVYQKIKQLHGEGIQQRDA